MKMNIKKGDAVMVIAGSEKGKSGQVIASYPDANRVVIENVNVIKKTHKARSAQDKSGIVSQPAAVNASNVMIVCPGCNKPSRIGHTIVQENGKDVKKRICKKCGAVLDVTEVKAKSAAKKATRKTKTTKKAEKTADKE